MKFFSFLPDDFACSHSFNELTDILRHNLNFFGFAPELHKDIYILYKKCAF